MSQRWPVLHRQASDFGSMTAFRHSWLAGKRSGKIDGSSIRGEFDTFLRASGRSKPTTKSSTMPCVLECLGPIPCVGTARKLGFGGTSPGYSDLHSVGLDSLSRHHMRCHKVGGRSSRVILDAVNRRLGSKVSLGFGYLIYTRNVDIKHLRPFSFHGWPISPGCSSLVREINSRSIMKIKYLRSLAECVASSRDRASVEDDGLSKVALSSNFAEEIVGEGTFASTRSLSNEAECASEIDTVPDLGFEEFKEGSIAEVEQKVPTESQADPTIIVFDIETTGFLSSGSKIVELACRDLAGGDRSTMETLVNPYQPVPLSSTAVHKITSEMVNRYDIPSWTEVMTSFIDFVESRRKGSEKIVLVAHNGRRFDVPFIMKECYECSVEIPAHWYFLDTIDLAKTMLKKRFGKTKLYNLQYLYYDCYNLPRLQDAHRAGVDVDMLANVFGKLLLDLEMPVSELLGQAFKASDIELKPGLLSRENNDRYTSLSKELDETLVEQSMSELIIYERNVDIQSDSKLDTLSERFGQRQDFEAEEVSSSHLETEEHWNSSASIVPLCGNLMSKNSCACSEEIRKQVLEEDDFLTTPLPASAAQSLGDGHLNHYEDSSNEGSTTRAEDVVRGVIQSDVKAVNVTEALSPASTVEDLLGLSRDPSAPKTETVSCKGKFVLDNAQDNREFEFEEALGLVLGNEEGMEDNKAFEFEDALGLVLGSEEGLMMENKLSAQSYGTTVRPVAARPPAMASRCAVALANAPAVAPMHESTNLQSSLLTIAAPPRKRGSLSPSATRATRPRKNRQPNWNLHEISALVGLKREMFLEELEAVNSRDLMTVDTNKWIHISQHVMKAGFSPCLRDGPVCKTK